MKYRTADESDVVTLAEMRWEFQIEDNEALPIVSKTENVYTQPAYRRRGIGSQLMQHVLNWAKHQEIDVLIVSISEESVTFHERAGFTAKNEWMECPVKNYSG